MTRTVVRTFSARAVIVTTIHPQVGRIDRGRIIPTPGPYGRWRPVTPDAEWLPEVVGDYLDAEVALLDATAGLDEPISTTAEESS